MKKLLLLGTLFLAVPAAAQVPQQCVTNAQGQGTGDAISVPLLPCGLATNILILTLPGANATTSPTLQMSGYPALPIMTSAGGQPAIGQLPGAGAVVLLTGTGSSWLIVSNATTPLATPVTVPNGGTGDTTLGANGLLFGNGTSAVGVTAAGTTGQYLKGTTSSPPGWGTLASDAVTGLSFGTTGLTPSTTTQGSITVAGTLVVANGGSGLATRTAHSLQVGNGTGAVTQLGVGATGTVLTGVTGSDPVFAAATGVAVTSLSFGTTGLTPNTGTQGAITVAGTLGVANGGTGVATLTGIPLFSGTSAITAATAGTDYAKPTVASSWTALQTFSGSTTVAAASLVNAKEPATISTTAATGTINYDVTTQSVLYYTTNASANWTLNIRANSGHTLDSIMSTGDVITITFLVTQGGTPFYNNALTVDGSSVTPKCQGGTCPAAGNASGIDVYTYAVVKTGSATFTVLESLTQFK